MATVVILTGMSGAGKSTALFAFEEMEYYCIENVPLPLYDQLFKLIASGDERYQKAVVSVNLTEASQAIDIAKKQSGLTVRVVGLVATIDQLLSRYKLTRHAHPLQTKGSTLSRAIKQELALFNDGHGLFDVVIDTSSLSVADFRSKLFKAFLGKPTDSLTLAFVSFGYKYGIPADVDLIIDARILPNPFWVNELRDATGYDPAVIKYVFEHDTGREYLQNVEKYIRYYLSFFIKESRPFYTIGIGCTGGQHRSVAVAEYLANLFGRELKTTATHRDLHTSPKGDHES
ncbi:MAG: RNase adapter RapZ [Bacilli bacterium]|jgi:UPF0042 nucleotide-binding protein